MTCEQLKVLYSTLNSIYTDYHKAYCDLDKGKNKQIRSTGERKVNSLIHKAMYEISRYDKNYELLIGGENISSFERTIFLDEFQQPRYFGRDLSEYLNKIQNRMNDINCH